MRTISKYSFWYLDNGVLTSCRFKEQELRSEWRLILQQEANGTLGLLRENSINDGSVLHMICNETDVTQLSCTNGQFDIPLPLPHCSNPPKPQIRKTHDFYCPYTAYCVGFEFSCNNAYYFVTAYRTCFDHERMRTVYTANKAYPYGKWLLKYSSFSYSTCFLLKLGAGQTNYSLIRMKFLQ